MPQFDPNTYVDVQERINRFWSEYKDGAIITDLVYSPDFDHAVIVANVFKHKDDAKPSAAGIAAEERGKDYKAGANFTSWHENAETSAIGRALANMGYATSREDRPSRQEMTKVATNERRAELVSPAPLNADAARMQRLHGVANEKGLGHHELHLIAVGRGKASLKDLTPQELDALTNWLAEKAEPPAIQKAIDAGREVELTEK